jgi:hypothetical protein
MWVATRRATSPAWVEIMKCAAPLTAPTAAPGIDWPSSPAQRGRRYGVKKGMAQNGMPPER